jgi:hypothetical protein
MYSLIAVLPSVVLSEFVKGSGVAAEGLMTPIYNN